MEKEKGLKIVNYENVEKICGARPTDEIEENR